MSTAKLTESDILKHATDAFRREGFAATSMSELAGRLGVKKGSFYHYYPSKRALLVAVLTQVSEHFQEEVFPEASQKVHSPSARLVALIHGLQAYYLDMEPGCLMVNLATELSEDHAEAREVIQLYFEGWLAALEQVFLSRYPRRQAVLQAAESLTDLIGGLTLTRLYGDVKHLHEAVARGTGRLK